MHRFYLLPEQCQSHTLFLTVREAHHALHVLRLRRGEQVTVLDGAGHEFNCTVEQSDRDKIQLKVTDKRDVPPPLCRITLLQAIPKGKLFESIIQKATELGAARIVPLLTERTVTRVDSKEAARKTAKWQLVAIEASKQCGAAWLPEVTLPFTPAQFLARNEAFELPLLASLQSDSRHPRTYFDAFQKQHNRKPASASIWIGPEGDFTP